MDSLGLKWASDLDGDLYMCADDSEPQRFQWEVTLLRPAESAGAPPDWIRDPLETEPGDSFLGWSAWPKEWACWFVFHREGFVEIRVPTTGGIYAAPVGVHIAHPGRAPRPT